MSEAGETVNLETKSESDKTESRLSQRDFQPTPYRASMWEIVGEPKGEATFLPLELSVFRNEMADADPMFEQFDPQILAAGSRAWHHPFPGTMGAAPGADGGVAGSSISEAELETRLAEKYQAGVEAGRVAALEEMQAEQAKLKEQLASLTQWISTEAKETFIRLEKEGVNLALQVARKILITTAEVKPEYIVQILSEAVKALGATKPLRIRVAPQDLEFIQVVGLPPQLSETELGVSYVADEAIHTGCVVETEFGEVDLQLDTMWEQIRDRLYEVYK